MGLRFQTTPLPLFCSWTLSPLLGRPSHDTTGTTLRNHLTPRFLNVRMCGDEHRGCPYCCTMRICGPKNEALADATLSTNPNSSIQDIQAAAVPSLFSRGFSFCR